MVIGLSEVLYILGDADRVREKVEAAMFDHDLDRLAAFSRTLSKAISNVVEELERDLNAKTIMAGGDDVLFTIECDQYSRSILDGVALRFYKTSKCAISFGVATSVEAAYLNLRKAKAAGGGVIESGFLR